MNSEEEEPLLNKDVPSHNAEISQEQTRNRNLFLTSGAVLFGSLSLGVTLGMSSPMIPDMEKDETPNALQMTPSDYSWFGSLITLGAMFGGLAGGGLIQIFGRKMTAMLCGLPFVGGMLLMSYATNVAMLFSGRAITGFAGGVASLVVPTYISETSTTHLRGLIGSANQLVITFGIFLAYALGIFLTWRWLAIACAVPGVLLTICSAFIPETPRYLLARNRSREARKSLSILRGGHSSMGDELALLQASIGQSATSVSWFDVMRERKIRAPLLLSLGVMFFQQAGGINCIMFYSKTIFKDAGFTSDAMLNVALLLLAGLQIIFTLISCFIMDKAGRKLLLVISGSLMGLSAGTFGLYFQLTDGGNSSNNLTWLALVSLLVYVSAFSIGLGPIPWLLLSEIIPVSARGKASGLSTAFNWLLAFIVTKEFHDMQVVFTTQGTFWIFAGVCVIGVIYHALLLPETKGKTLEEISAYFEGRRSDSEESDVSPKIGQE